jgi:hypothetical protein
MLSCLSSVASVTSVVDKQWSAAGGQLPVNLGRHAQSGIETSKLSLGFPPTLEKEPGATYLHLVRISSLRKVAVLTKNRITSITATTAETISRLRAVSGRIRCSVWEEGL